MPILAYTSSRLDSNCNGDFTFQDIVFVFFGYTTHRSAYEMPLKVSQPLMLPYTVLEKPSHASNSWWNFIHRKGYD